MFALVNVLLASIALVSAQAPVTVPLTFDTTYDIAAQSLATVSCSNGPNGLLTKGFTTFGSLPNFPNISGSSVVAGFNSANCGTCWTLRFQNNSTNVLVIDHAANGFNMARTANDVLTGGAGVFFGTVQVTAVQVNATNCGLPA